MHKPYCYQKLPTKCIQSKQIIKNKNNALFFAYSRHFAKTLLYALAKALLHSKQKTKETPVRSRHSPMTASRATHPFAYLFNRSSHTALLRLELARRNNQRFSNMADNDKWINQEVSYVA